eukprot:scaffold418931_cov21-Prasinocladus_malaysianus.AAC.1
MREGQFYPACCAPLTLICVVHRVASNGEVVELVDYIDLAVSVSCLELMSKRKLITAHSAISSDLTLHALT